VANQRYETGNYDEAIAGYEDIIAMGVRNSDVYYNLGNAYFKQGDMGRAILNYRRAQRLDPPDTDIAANLALARTQTVDKLEVPPEGVLINIVEIAEEWLTLNQAALLALGLWLLIGVAFIVAIFQPRWRRLSAGVMAILAIFLLIGLISMANRLYRETQSPPAVIIAPKVDVTSGPGGGDQYLVEFELHAGAEVRLLESRVGWRRITLPGNLQGWVPSEAVEPVIDAVQN
jgi:tetratricopeptide (TPR) repeat protein